MSRFFLLSVALALAACTPAPAPRVTGTQEQQPGAVRITQFYAEPVVAKGEKANLCYGVENAKSVKLDPPVEKVWPAMARCFPVDPSKASRYTLTAEDASGRSVSQFVEIRVGPPRPRIIEISVNKTEVKPGELVALCYKAANATSVDAGPGKWVSSHTNDQGCLSDQPQKTTTYHVKITGGSGQTDAEQVTVVVRP